VGKPILEGSTSLLGIELSQKYQTRVEITTITNTLAYYDAKIKKFCDAQSGKNFAETMKKALVYF
jgi:hypothetical protein